MSPASMVRDMRLQDCKLYDRNNALVGVVKMPANAIDAVPQGGRIRVRTWAEPARGGAEDPSNPNGKRAQLCVLIGDNGSGIPLESQPQIFDPFYTTKPMGVGTGIGLGIVQRIVEQYGGTIRFASEPGNTEFIVRLPVESA